ncbi:T9SS type A sorting domain-containing protein [Salibacter halophilus]|uniref:T9SS type A sorting domain-containing protein n=1 Tax=Salibacter halophilus TaxID=1803916 RepID=A0A6N6MAE7_9FLAO|nr:T9SS type A sorting domain-containing protein [Salibacter halophilus]KAB1065680.1 T9SS type A sorting domain-containing protein [Salibacter halophilus]
MKFNLFKALSLIIIMIVLTQLAFSQPEWKKLSGLDNTNSLTSISKSDHNGNVFAITPDSWIYHSADSGKSWAPFQTALSHTNIGDVNASDGSDRVYVATGSDGIAWTDDFGANWDNDLLTGGGGTSGFGATILDIGVRGNDAFVMTFGDPFSSNPDNGIFVCSNNANSFTHFDSVPFFPHGGFAFYKDSLIYIAANDGIYRTEQSANWSNVAFAGFPVTNLEVGGDMLFATVQYNTNDVVLYESSDFGDNWQQINGLPNNAVITDMDYSEEDDILFATTDKGVFRQLNGSWEKIDSETSAFNIMALGDEKALFSGQYTRGANVGTNNDFVSYTEGFSLDADYLEITDNSQLYYGSVYTAFLSQFNFKTLEWTNHSAYDELQFETKINDIAVDSSGQLVLGGTHFLARLTDEGNNFQVIGTDSTAPLAPVYGILNPQQIYAGQNGSISIIQHQTQDYVDFTPDFGQSWRKLFESGANGNPTVFKFNDIISNQPVHYIFGQSLAIQPMLLQSKDDGANWNEISLPDSLAQIHKMVFDRTGENLYVAAGQSLYRRDTISQSWDSLNFSYGAATNVDVEIKFDHENNLYVMVRSTFGTMQGQGIYYTEDNGNTFTKIDYPVDGNGNPEPFTTFSFTDDNVLMTVRDRRMANSNDKAGVYYYSDSTISMSGKPVLSSAKKSFNVYPNPASDYTKLNLQGFQPNKVNLISQKGEMTTVPVRGDRVDLTGMASGIYIVHIERDGVQHTSRLMIVNH